MTVTAQVHHPTQHHDHRKGQQDVAVRHTLRNDRTRPERHLEPLPVEQLADQGRADRPGVPQPGGVWADLGAGGGAFTRTLAELLGASATIYAVDQDAQAVRGLEAAPSPGARIVSLIADFTQHLELPVLDRVLIANALHYARDQAGVLERIAGYLRPGGRLVLVEYEGRSASYAVPYPVPLARFVSLCDAAGLEPPVVLGSRASRYGGWMYTAVARRREA